MPQFIQLLHDLVHHIATLMLLVLMQFPLSGFGSLSNMLGDIVQSSLIQMIDGDPHVLQTAGNFFMWWSLVTMRLLRKHTQFRLDLLSLTTNIGEHFICPGFVRSKCFSS